MSAPIAPTNDLPESSGGGAFSKMAAMSTKGAGLIAKSLTLGNKPYKGISRRERLSRKPVTMTPSSKQVFHMLTTQTEKQEVFDAIKGRMSVHQHSDSGNGGGHGGGHGHKSAMPKKAGMAHLSQQAIDTSWVFDQHYVINPRSYQRKAWDIMLTLLVFYLISLLPWQLGVPFYHAPKELYKFDTVLEVIFWLDMIATLNTGFIHAGEVELDRGEIVEHYLSTWFLVDLIGNFPFYAFIGKRGGKGFKLLKWLKLNKLFRIGKLVRYLRDYVKFASIMKYSAALIVFIHITTCLAVGQMFGHHDLHYVTYWDMYWHALAQVISLAVGGNIRSNSVTLITHYEDDDHSRRGLASTDDGTGDDHPTFDIDTRRFTNELSVAIILIGTILFIFLSASIVVILSNRSNTTMKFKLKIENMKTELEYYDIDELLADRVMEFYDYLWFNQLNSDENSVHKDSMLSAELRRELILTIYSEMLTSTPFLSACSEDCVANVANKVVNTIAMPADFIIRKKDVGRELFIIKKGMVGVFNDLQYLKSLQKGQYFGEVALLGEKKHRTATVRAISVCELCVLYAHDFASISAEYPELLVNMTQYMNATHLDADLVKNPRVQARRKTNLGEQVNAAKAEKGTPGQRKQVAAMLSDGSPQQGFLQGVQNLSSRAIGSVRKSLMSPSTMLNKSPAQQTPQHAPQRNMSVGSQMAGLLSNMNGADAFSPAGRRVEKDEVSMGFTKQAPSPDDVRGMISGLLAARLEPEPEGDEDEDDDDDDDDDYEYAKPAPSDMEMQAQHEADAAAVNSSEGADPLLIHTQANASSSTDALSSAQEQLAMAKVENAGDKQTIDQLQQMVNDLKGNLDTTNKSLEELSKVVIITHAAATNEGHELVDALREDQRERTASFAVQGSMVASPNGTFTGQQGAISSPNGTYNRDKDEKSISRNLNKRKKKPTASNVHISKPGGSIYDAENEDPGIYATASSSNKGFNSEGSMSFSESRRAGGKIRGASKSPPPDAIVKVPSVDSVDLHIADGAAQEEIQRSLSKEVEDNKPKVQSDEPSNSFFMTPKIFSALGGSSYNGNPDPNRSSPDSPGGRYRKDSHGGDADAVRDF